MAPGNSTVLESLEGYLYQYPEIELFTPNSTEYDAARECFVIRSARPLAVAEPTSAEDVEALVKFSLENNLDFNIRGGGHDSAGRSQVDKSLMIDMRQVDYVEINEDQTQARIGGGIQLGKLAERLGEYGLITPMGSISTVGYVGWATLGGYGPFSSLYSLGVEQILGAKLINAAGELIVADEELLHGIRGGGGIFGIIVELTISVYPLKEMLASTLTFESSNITDTWLTWTTAWGELLDQGEVPDALQLQQFAMDIPSLGGKVFQVTAAWVDQDQDAGRDWIDKISALANCTDKSIQAVSLYNYTENNEDVTPWPAYGRAHSVSLKNFTLQSIAVLGQYSASLVGSGTGIAVHELRHALPNNASVFGNRMAHHMVEIISVTTNASVAAAAEQWGQGLATDLREKDPGNVLEGYISLNDDNDTNLRAAYGPNYDTLVHLKEKYDPTNVYKYAIPKLPI
ncbi:putative FAD-binding PCMH-type domain-containing protein [Seiridium cardinale]|uniref:FAD-binding PCMH-type domain-containing protein n=1 Tax=Seiridium cardinale TaxID=138064 RepID=A0ABR2Y2S7_9PEZI